MLILILTQFFTSTAITIDYSLSNQIIQSTATTLTLNFTTTFTAQDIKIEIKLPDQIPYQNNIVCGVSGLTNGACNLLYSKFIVTFKSATPSFQIKFVNMQNPYSNYSDPVQFNCSVISTNEVLFVQTLQLVYQLLDLTFSLNSPQTTYELGNLVTILELQSFIFPTTGVHALITISDGLFNQTSSLLSGVDFTSSLIQFNSISIEEVSFKSVQTTLTISQFQTFSLIPLTVTITLFQGVGYMAQKSKILQITNPNSQFQFNFQSNSNIIGNTNNITMIVCNLIETTTFAITFPSGFSNLPSQTVKYVDKCHNIQFINLKNTYQVGDQEINIKGSIGQYQSITKSIIFTTKQDTANLQLTQNNTVALSNTLITLVIKLNQNITNPLIVLAHNYILLSCSSGDQQCDNKQLQLNIGDVNQITIQFLMLLPSCNLGTISVSIYSDKYLIATTNTVQPKMTQIPLNSVLTISDELVGNNSTFTLILPQNDLITKYTIDSQLTIQNCTDCTSFNSNNLEYNSNSGSLQFTATNLKSNKPYQFTLKAYQDTCLLNTQTFKQSAKPINLTITASGNNHIQQMKSNWTLSVSPQITDQNGYLKVPLKIPSTEPLKYNETYALISKNPIELYNLTNIGGEQIWELTYINSDGYVYAYGAIQTQNLTILPFSNFSITQQNTDQSANDNLFIDFTNTFDIPLNGQLIIEFNNLPVSDTLLNGDQIYRPFQLAQGNQNLNFSLVYPENQTNKFSSQINLTSVDSDGVILQKSTINYNFNYICLQAGCDVCTLQQCQTCKSTYEMQNQSCIEISQNNTNNTDTNTNTNTTTNPNNTNTDNNTNISSNNNSEQHSIFEFTPPILSPIMAVIFLFSLSRKIISRDAQTFIIYYSTIAILEHIVSVFLLVWYFLNNEMIFGFCMISLIILHLMAQLYMVFMNLFKIDPEYIGVRQQFKGLRLIHIISLTFCGRLMLLFVSKISKSYIWCQPWTNRVSILQRLQNLLKFQLIEELGVCTLVILSMLKTMYLFYIEIIFFMGIQISISVYAHFYLREQKNNELKLTYV